MSKIDAYIPINTAILLDRYQIIAEKYHNEFSKVDPKLNELNRLVNELIESGIPEDKVEKAIEQYLLDHPLDEKDPTVPEWAKAKDKPTYTSSEVGALDINDEMTLEEIDAIFSGLFG